MKKYLKYFVRKRSLYLVAAAILLLLISALILGRLSIREMKSRINEDFNYQQLELAKHAAGILTENFKNLKREILTLSLSPSIQYIEPVSWASRMEISFSSVSDYGVIQIMLVNADEANSYSVNYMNSSFIEKGFYGDKDYFKWCKKPENKGKIYISDATQGIAQYSEPGLVMIIATPVYQVSRDAAYPIPTGQFSGVLLFVLDASSFAKRFVGPIRSGRTGYAWVIDGSGNFMYHLEKDFIGQNAFKVRKFKDPHISFSEINLIQKTKMLEGKEGISCYISGWHRGMIGTTKKLIAYSPVHIQAANIAQTWSVAVVAPVSEVEDAIHTVYVRQSMIQGAFTAAVIIIFLFLMANERTWLRTLEQEVKEKTKDLEDYAERLRRSEERYRSLIESADDLIYTLDKNYQILSVNQYFKGFTGQQEEQILGKNIMDIIEYKAPEIARSILKKVFKKPRTLVQEEQVRIGDREYWLDTKYKPVIMSEGQIGSVLVISRDITEHKRMEGQLFHTEKLASLGSLSAGVAHEINNPIAIILGFTELLIERFSEDSKEYEILKSIERQGNSCQSIIENLLAFARIPEKTTTETDVSDNIQKIITVVMNTLLTKKVELKTDINDDLPKVRGDGQQLEQVFLNIINNAVAAMDDGGILNISAHLSDGTVNISFTDTGPGISPENVDKIFEPFFTTKKVGEGTGLGLSVSYGILTKFGGDIRVKSQTKAEGKEPGTTFTVVLPVVDTGNRASDRE
ncbi:MAG: PAS domain S-box protein [Deltaproteobacteria bacterium]|nr:PAS domain S-box protein [Deltaproteobacteria bacterium]